jgi:hypothetical protein
MGASDRRAAVAAGDAHMHVAARRALQIRHGDPLGERWLIVVALHPNGERHLRSRAPCRRHPSELTRRCRRSAVPVLAEELRYEIRRIVPAGETVGRIAQARRARLASRYGMPPPVRRSPVVSSVDSDAPLRRQAFRW